MYLPIVSVLVLTACIVGVVSSASAGSVGLEFLDQAGGLKAPKPGLSDPKPTGTDEDVAVEKYLFLDQEDYRFDDASTFDSGLSPASGDDIKTQPGAGREPVLLFSD